LHVEVIVRSAVLVFVPFGSQIMDEPADCPGEKCKNLRNRGEKPRIIVWEAYFPIKKVKGRATRLMDS
jgi:hypothetical protein